jgi:hypothetical protein
VLLLVPGFLAAAAAAATAAAVVDAMFLMSFLFGVEVAKAAHIFLLDSRNWYSVLSGRSLISM